MSYYWKVCVNGEDHTLGLSFEEAKNLANDLNEQFPENDYIPMPTPDYEEESDSLRFSARGQADGWEDMFPDYED